MGSGCSPLKSEREARLMKRKVAFFFFFWCWQQSRAYWADSCPEVGLPSLPKIKTPSTVIWTIKSSIQLPSVQSPSWSFVLQRCGWLRVSTLGFLPFQVGALASCIHVYLFLGLLLNLWDAHFSNFVRKRACSHVFLISASPALGIIGA